MLLLLPSELSPTYAARYLSENFGYSVSPSVIVKWDNLILRKIRPKQGEKGKLSRRVYDYSDITLFNAIFVMRSLGYSINEIKRVFDLNLRDPNAEKECLAFIDSIRAKIAKQKKGLDLYDSFFDALKKKRIRSASSDLK